MRTEKITGMELKSCMLLINRNLAKLFMAFRKEKWERLIGRFKTNRLVRVEECEYMYALFFSNEKDRDKAYDDSLIFAKQMQMKYAIGYKGELVSLDMIKELNENKGDFSVWEKHFEPLYKAPNSDG